MNKTFFRTPVTVAKTSDSIRPGDGILFMGSCFAGNMGRFMVEARFPALVNPFGVLYNPFSIARAFNAMMDLQIPDESELVYNNGLWHSFYYHGSFSHPEATEVVRQIRETTLLSHTLLKNARFLVITFGTAYVYEHRDLHQVVANCHKFPESDFNRYLLDPEDIIAHYKELIVALRVYNPTLHIIFTVSPVRHLKDGAHGNQLSKSVLLLAVEQLTSLFDKVWYFPAYEIVLDELRDYRFYDAAMTQPNDIAINYIWEQFMDATFSKEAHDYYNEVQKVIRARLHRNTGHKTAEYRMFLQKTLDLVRSLSTRYPKSLLESDRKLFESKLESLLE